MNMKNNFSKWRFWPEIERHYSIFMPENLILSGQINGTFKEIIKYYQVWIGSEPLR
jgi:hypothetical protein